MYVAVGLGFAQLAEMPIAFGQSEKPSNLNEVVITASRSSKKQSEIGKVVRVISSEEISRSQGRSLPELLNTVPGLTVGGAGSNPGNLMSVFLRGSSSGNTLILIDGIAVNDASSTSGEYNLSAIAIDQIERIEILKGGNSTLYGSDAVAGVINIITKKGNGPLKGNLLLTGGSYQTFKQAAGVSGTIGKTDISLNLSNLNSKSFSTAQAMADTSKFEKDGFNQKSIGFNISQALSNRVSLLGYVNYNINGADFDAGSFTDAKDYTYKKNTLLLNFGSVINLNKGKLKFNLSQNNVQNKLDYSGSMVDNKGKITNVEGVYTSQLSKFIDITSGINYKFSKTDQISEYGKLSSDSAKNNIASVFTSLFFSAGKFFRMELGGRFNHHNQFGNNLNYTINPSFLISDKIKVFFNASSAYKVPTLYQLTSEYKNVDGLKPESSHTLETGFDINLLNDKLTINAALYKRKIKDAIDFGAQKNGGYGYLNQNQENTKGLELELGTTLVKNLNISTFYAYTDGKIKTIGVETSSLSRRPKNTFGASAGYQFNKLFYMNVIYKYTGNRTDKYNNSNNELVNVDLNHFDKLDLYLQYKPKEKVTLFVDAKNLLNTKYNDFVGYTSMGINFSAGLTLHFN